jgi:hypothetical protein
MLKAGFLALLAGAGVASLGFASDANTVFYGVNLGGCLFVAIMSTEPENRESDASTFAWAFGDVCAH